MSNHIKMKTIPLLKKLINFYYYLLLSVLLLFVAILPVLFATDKIKSINIVEGFDLSNLSTLQFALLLISSTVIYLLYICAIYFLKESLDDLSNENYFSKKVIKNFNTSGKLILLSGVCYAIFNFLIALIFMNEIKLGIDNSFLVCTLIGLFLMFLSEVFEKGRKTKQENDLTI